MHYELAPRYIPHFLSLDEADVFVSITERMLRVLADSEGSRVQYTPSFNMELSHLNEADGFKLEPSDTVPGP